MVGEGPVLNCLLPALALVSFPLQYSSRCKARPFCLTSAHARCLTRPCYCLLIHGKHAYPPVGAHHRQKKSGKTKKSCLYHLRSFCYLGAAPQAEESSAKPFTHHLQQYKTLHNGEGRVIIENTPRRVITQYLLSTLPFSNIPQLSHNDSLRHSRRCQLLLPFGSRSQAEGCSSMRHLWIHRTAHSQAIPPLRWLRASHF